MKLHPIAFAFFVLLSACNISPDNKSEETIRPDTSANNTESKHSRSGLLAWSQAELVADMNSDNSGYMLELINKDCTNQAVYENYILATSYFKASGCTGYSGKVSIAGDTILLDIEPDSHISCRYPAFYKVTYLIRNPLRQSFVLIKTGKWRND